MKKQKTSKKYPPITAEIKLLIETKSQVMISKRIDFPYYFKRMSGDEDFDILTIGKVYPNNYLILRKKTANVPFSDKTRYEIETMYFDSVINEGISWMFDGQFKTSERQFELLRSEILKSI